MRTKKSATPVFIYSKKGRVEIDNPREVPFHRDGRFVIHRAVEKCFGSIPRPWILTHAESGMKVGPPHSIRRNCIKLAQQRCRKIMGPGWEESGRMKPYLDAAMKRANNRQN